MAILWIDGQVGHKNPNKHKMDMGVKKHGHIPDGWPSRTY